jgi:hypothetical protein
MSTATLPPSIDLIRLTKIYDLHQRLASASMQLVHTEEVSGVAGQRARSSSKRLGRGAVPRSVQEASEVVSELQHLLYDLSFRLKSHARCTQNLLDLTDQAQQCVRIEVNVFDHR